MSDIQSPTTNKDDDKEEKKEVISPYKQIKDCDTLQE